jgi:ubiquinone/menaquinone biosynthesis C-methylase UbiE
MSIVANEIFADVSPEKLAWPTGKGIRESLIRKGRQHIYRAVDKLTGYCEGLNALDIGCGSGLYTRMLSDKGAIATGIDTDAHLIEYAKTYSPCSKFIKADALDLPLPSDNFDEIVCIGLFHHLNDKQLIRCMNEIKRVSRVRTGLVFEVRNRNNPIIRKLYSKDTRSDLTLNPRTVREFNTLLTGYGFRICHKINVILPFLSPFIVVQADRII